MQRLHQPDPQTFRLVMIETFARAVFYSQNGQIPAAGK
jgi:hypothetical protein